MRELIVPVGTSLITGWMPKIESGEKISAAWVSGSTNEGEPSARLWIPRFKAAMSNGAARTSAEIDSIRTWLAKQPDVRISRVTLLVSDTPPAQWVAAILTALLPDVFSNAVEVKSRTIRRLKPSDMREGLVEFIRVSAATIKEAQARGAQPVVNATPGFKAETSLLTLLGALLGAETIYLHEHMRDIVTVPVIPLKWGLEQHEIELLRMVGASASRDTVRDLGIGAHPSLWAFLERAGDGRDEVWGLSALGEMVLASSNDQAAVQLPARDNGDAQFIASVKELGHMPTDAPKLAQEVGKRFAFVKLIRVVGFTSWKPEGLLRQSDDDSAKGIVRLRLQSRANDQLLIMFLLHTTASNEPEWHLARQQIGDAYGRVSLVQELAEAQTEEREPAAQDEVPLAFEQLRVEELLQDQLNQSETRVRDICDQLSSQIVKLEKSEKRINELEKSLKNAQERQQLRENELKQREQALKEREQEVADLKSANESLRRELEAARSQSPAPSTGQQSAALGV